MQCISASYERILTNFFRGMGRGPKTNRLHFGVDLDYNRDPGFLEVFFVYCSDSYRIKHDNHTAYCIASPKYSKLLPNDLLKHELQLHTKMATEDHSRSSVLGSVE